MNTHYRRARVEGTRRAMRAGRYKGVGRRDILQWWRNHRLELPTLSDPARNTFCVMASGAAGKRLFRMDGHVVNSRANLKFVTERHNSFSTLLSKLRKKRCRLAVRIRIFILHCLSWPYVDFEMNHWKNSH